MHPGCIMHHLSTSSNKEQVNPAPAPYWLLPNSFLIGRMLSDGLQLYGGISQLEPHNVPTSTPQQKEEEGEGEVEGGEAGQVSSLLQRIHKPEASH